jgi:hypothetical protein
MSRGTGWDRSRWLPQADVPGLRPVQPTPSRPGPDPGLAARPAPRDSAPPVSNASVSPIRAAPAPRATPPAPSDISGPRELYDAGYPDPEFPSGERVLIQSRSEVGFSRYFRGGSVPRAPSDGAISDHAADRRRHDPRRARRDDGQWAPRGADHAGRGGSRHRDFGRGVERHRRNVSATDPTVSEWRPTEDVKSAK